MTESEKRRRCPRCGVLHVRKHSWCNACHAANMRATRKPYRELTAEQRRRLLARNYARQYVLRGKLERGTSCERCGCAGPLQMHHEDYGKPLAVTWLCGPCHRQHHRETA